MSKGHTFSSKLMRMQSRLTILWSERGCANFTDETLVSLYWYIVWLASLDRSCANRRMKQVTQSTEPCQKWFAGSWKVTDPCGNLGETKFASPIKLSRKKEVFWWRSSAVYQCWARRKAFWPMIAQAAGCWTNQSGSLLWSTWKNVVLADC